MKQYQQVTDRIIAMLEAGTRPWSQSWAGYAGGGRPRRADGTPYRGANVINLWAAGMCRGFGSPYWLTYKKAQELGAQVKKGAKSELAFYVGTISKTEERNGQEKERVIPFMKSYCVFNAEEIEGLAPHYYAPAARAILDPAARIQTADDFIAATGAVIREGGGRAFYRPSTDEIHMPEFGSFVSASAYYGTALHELAHWSGAEKRLDRTKGKAFADPDYAFEELVAELSAAYLSADLAISAEPREDHASYIAGWLKALRDDNRAIFRAASLAEKACDYLHSLQSAESMAEELEEAMAA
jgi:antirestriction protein ArdC